MQVPNPWGRHGCQRSNYLLNDADVITHKTVNIEHKTVALVYRLKANLALVTAIHDVVEGSGT